MRVAELFWSSPSHVVEQDSLDDRVLDTEAVRRRRGAGDLQVW